MDQQKFFFKEHKKINLFDLQDETRLDLANIFKLKLVSTSNTYGFVAIGYKNLIKILNVNVFQSSDDSKPDHIAIINIDPNQNLIQINLNCQETHLFALTCKQGNQNDFEYFIHVYALESINFDAVKNNSQSPVCINTIGLEKDNNLINDLCVSPSEPDVIALCKDNGLVQIISKIFDKNYKVVSNALNAYCICWSPKGKNLAACCKDNFLNMFNHELELKSSYQCLMDDLKPTNINWLAKKQFIISYEDADKMPLVTFHEIITDKNSQTESHSSVEYENLVYGSNSDATPELSSINLSFIPEWNLILCAYSRSPELGLLHKKTESDCFGTLEIENFRCTLPLTEDSDDMFPVGLAINFNTCNKIDFENYGKQPESPLVLFLTDTGSLMTFYAINLEMKDRSICQMPKKLPFKNVQAPAVTTGFQAPSQPTQQKPTFNFATGSAALNGSIFNIPTPQSQSQPQVQQQQQQLFKPISGMTQAKSSINIGEQSNNLIPVSKTAPQSLAQALSQQNIKQQNQPQQSNIGFSFQQPQQPQQPQQQNQQHQQLQQLQQLQQQQNQQHQQLQQQMQQQQIQQQQIQQQQMQQQQMQQQQMQQIVGTTQDFQSQKQLPAFGIPSQPQQKLPQQQQQQSQAQQPPFQMLHHPQQQYQPQLQQQQQQQDLMRLHLLQKQQQSQQIQQIPVKPAEIQSPQMIKKKENFHGIPENGLKEFCRELEDFKISASKLFNGKDLAKQLINLSIIKETKKTQEDYNKLNDEMKKLNEDSSNLRTTIFSDFHNLEKLRLIKNNIDEKKGINLINQFDQDPFTKSRYENVKKLYYYLGREIPNMTTHIELQRKKKQEQLTNMIPFDGIYEGIKIIDLNITENNKKINKLIEQIKFAKLGRNILHDYNLNSPRSSEFQPSFGIHSVENEENLYPGLNKSAAEKVNKRESMIDLSKKMSTLELENESQEQIKKACEKNSRFFAQLYDILRKRKQIPTQTVSFDRLDLLNSKYDESKGTTVVLNDNSFLHLNAPFSPNESQVQPTLQVSQPSTPIQTQKLPISKPINQQQIQQSSSSSIQTQEPKFEINQQPITQLQPLPQTVHPQVNQQIQQQLQQPIPQKQQQQQQQPQITTQSNQPLTANVPFQTPPQNLKQTQISNQLPQPKFVTLGATTSTPVQSGPISFNIASPVTLANPSLNKAIPAQNLQQPSQQQQPQQTTQSIQKNLFPQLNTNEVKTPQQETSQKQTNNLFGALAKPVQESKNIEEKTAQPQIQGAGTFTVKQGVAPSTSTTSLPFNLETKQPEIKKEQQQIPEKAPTLQPSSINQTNQEKTILTNLLNQSTFSQGQIKPTSTEGTKLIQQPQKIIDEQTLKNSTDTQQPKETTQENKPSQSKDNQSTIKPSGSLFGNLQTNQPGPGTNLFGNQSSAGNFSFSLGASSTPIKPVFSFGNLTSSAASATTKEPTPAAQPLASESNSSVPPTNNSKTETSKLPEQNKNVVEETKNITQPNLPAQIQPQPQPQSQASNSTTPVSSAVTTVSAITATNDLTQKNETTKTTEQAETNLTSQVQDQVNQTSSAQNKTVETSNKPAVQQTPLFSLSTGSTSLSQPVASQQTNSSGATTNNNSTSTSTTTPAPSFFGANLTSQQNQTQQQPANFFSFSTNQASNTNATTTPSSTAAPLQGTSTFSSFLPGTTGTTNPFAAIASASQKPPTEADADMDSGMNNNNAASANISSGLSFGSFGLGSNKPATNDPPKNIFGGSTFTAPAQPTSQTPKSPFGSILKTPTFSAQPQGQTQAPSLFGSNTKGAASGNLFGSNNPQPTSSTASGSLFSSFSTPQKSSFGSSAVFGGAPAFGSAPAPAPAFGAAPVFGSSVPSFGAASSNVSTGFGAPPTFGAGAGSVFGSATSTNNQPTFGSLAANNTGSSFGTFGQNSSNNQLGFGALAQQNQQSSLFSSFSGNNQNQSSGFTSPNSSSFTSYRK